MCILFAYVDDKPTQNSYKVILAVNRDEIYTRPTKMADFWGTNPDILGGRFDMKIFKVFKKSLHLNLIIFQYYNLYYILGRDMEPGREGGTWLGISKSGRIGSLLNVLQSRQALLSAGDRKGRGFLVNDLLNAPQINSIDYLTDIYERSAEYNPFTMVTIDVGTTSSCAPQICYYSSAADQKPQQLPTRIVHGVGNSFIATPFNKVKTGREEFASVVQQCNDVQKKDELISEILKIMKNQQAYVFYTF